MGSRQQRQSTNWKPSTPVSNNSTSGGFTLLELTVASVVAFSLLTVSLGFVSQQRQVVLGDRTRATANDNLRLASDLIGQDIKQAGERLDGDTLLPGISIIPGASASVPDTLVLQRQLLTEKLPVCQTISGSTRTIDVSVVTAPQVANCTYSYTAPSGGELPGSLTALQPTENLRSWRTYRCTLDAAAVSGVDPCTRTTNTTSCQQGGGTDRECSWAYIFDPVNNRGEFFLYSFEEQATCNSSTVFPIPTTRTCLRIRRGDSANWQNTYTYNPSGPASAQPQLYILEERRYSVISDASTSRTDDYVLQLSVNGQTPKRVANLLSNFQAWGRVPTSYSAPANWSCATGGTTGPNPASPSQWYCGGFNVDTATTPNPKYINDWQDLQGVTVTLTGLSPDDNLLKVDPLKNILSLTSEFYPRNVASKQ